MLSIYSSLLFKQILKCSYKIFADPVLQKVREDVSRGDHLRFNCCWVCGSRQSCILREQRDQTGRDGTSGTFDTSGTCGTPDNYEIHVEQQYSTSLSLSDLSGVRTEQGIARPGIDASAEEFRIDSPGGELRAAVVPFQMEALRPKLGPLRRPHRRLSIANLRGSPSRHVHHQRGLLVHVNLQFARN